MRLYEARSVFKRSTENPCGVLDDNVVADTPLVNTAADVVADTPLVNTAADMITRTWDLNYIVASVKTKMIERFPNFPSRLDSESFIDTDSLLINYDTLQNIIDEPNIAMKDHYRELYKLVRYINHIRTHGTISNLESESELQTDFQEVERLLESLMCSLNIGINAGEEMTNTDTSSSLSLDVLSWDNNYPMELGRAYIVIADAKRLIGYLNTMYKELHYNLIMRLVYSPWY